MTQDVREFRDIVNRPELLSKLPADMQEAASKLDNQTLKKVVEAREALTPLREASERASLDLNQLL